MAAAPPPPPLVRLAPAPVVPYGFRARSAAAADVPVADTVAAAAAAALGGSIERMPGEAQPAAHPPAALLLPESCVAGAAGSTCATLPAAGQWDAAGAMTSASIFDGTCGVPAGEGGLGAAASKRGVLRCTDLPERVSDWEGTPRQLSLPQPRRLSQSCKNRDFHMQAPVSSHQATQDSD